MSEYIDRSNLKQLLAAVLIALLFLLTGCAQKGSWHADDISDSNTSGLTIGAVQASIETGMTGGQVAEILGSPNIVSTDANGNQVWIYDRFSTDQVASGSSGNTLFFQNLTAGATRRSQSSTTVIIKFDENRLVNDIAYHSSRF